MLTSLENKEKYLYVDFEIECPLYYHKERYPDFTGFDSDAEREKFDKDWREVFAAAGWTIDGQDVRKGKSSLYVHPQQLLGTIAESLESEVVSIIGNAKTFYLREYPDGRPFVRRIEVKYDITADEQLEHVKKYRAEIENMLLESFRTKRKNLWWVDFQGKFDRIANQFAVKSLDEKVMGGAAKYVRDVVFQSLVADGKILCREQMGKPIYRTQMKSEHKNNMRICA